MVHRSNFWSKFGGLRGFLKFNQNDVKRCTLWYAPFRDLCICQEDFSLFILKQSSGNAGLVFSLLQYFKSTSQCIVSESIRFLMLFQMMWKILLAWILHAGIFKCFFPFVSRKKGVTYKSIFQSSISTHVHWEFMWAKNVPQSWVLLQEIILLHNHCRIPPLQIMDFY